MVDLPTVPAPAVVVPKKRKASAIDEGQENPSAQESVGSPNDEGQKVPSAQEDVAASVDPIKGRLRARTTKSGALPAPAAPPPPRKRARHVAKSAASAGDEADDVESEDDSDAVDNNAEAAYTKLRWLSIKEGLKLSLEHPPLTLRNMRLNPTKILAPTVLHPLAPDTYVVKIPYWKFDPAPDDPLKTLKATQHIHLYTPFNATVSAEFRATFTLLIGLSARKPST